MIRWRSIKVDDLYRLDLIQESSGLRYVRIREAGAQPTDGMVLTTKTYRGSILLSFHADPRASAEVVVEDGRSFGLDPHGIWMLREEIEYWRTHRSQEGLESPDAPWVNGIPPIFAPA